MRHHTPAGGHGGIDDAATNAIIHRQAFASVVTTLRTGISPTGW